MVFKFICVLAIICNACMGISCITDMIVLFTFSSLFSLFICILNIFLWVRFLTLKDKENREILEIVDKRLAEVSGKEPIIKEESVIEKKPSNYYE